jgi:IMP dehydrogenase/GMP reductase
MEKERWEECHGRKCPTKIIADGGISNFDDIQKCLALGADLVMSGSIFAKSWEACGEVICLHPTNLNMVDAIPYDKWMNKKDELIKTIHDLREDEDTFKDVIVAKKESLTKLENRRPYREYYGMSTKRAQRETGGSGKTTAEGISRPIPIEYHINKWADNMKSFLVSAMSYTDSRNLKEFAENTELIINLSGDKSFRK